MKVEESNITNNIYATHLAVKKDYLGWNATKGFEWIMLVQTSFGNRFEIDDEFRAAFLNAELSDLRTEEGFSTGDYTIRFISNNLVSNFKVPVRPASYEIYATTIDESAGTLTIYKPMNDDNRCSVSTPITINVCKQTPKKTLFGKKDTTPYYEINVPKIYPYVDGSIYYVFPANGGREYKYPIVEKMLGKTIKVIERNGAGPTFKSSNNGYQIEQKGV